MMKLCSFLDRYRDGELDAAERFQFENHLEECEDCRATVDLLDNIGKIVATVDVPLRSGFAERTARMAFSQRRSWDAMLLSLIRPARAWAAAAAVFLALGWFMKPILFAPSEGEGEIEALLTGTDSEMAREMGRIQTDEELLSLLQQEANR